MRTEAESAGCFDAEPPSIAELVWDQNDSGTATSRRGQSLSIGGNSGWLPMELLALAAESDLMTAFMARSRNAGIDVLGYASAFEVVPPVPDAPGPALLLRICAIVAPPATRGEVQRELEHAFLTAGICSLLSERLTVAADIFITPPGDG